MSIDYKKIAALNQSSLKKILSHPLDYRNAISKQSESTEEHFVFGSMVDIMLTGSKEEFDKKFFKVSAETTVSEAVKTIVDGIVGELKEINISLDMWKDYRPIILKHVKYQNYQPNWKDDTRIDAIIKSADSYVNLLAEADNRIIISELLYAKAVNCVAALRSDQFTGRYSKPWKALGMNITVHDKVVLQFEYKGHAIKGEIDRVIIDILANTVTVIDFKTTSKPIMGFMSEFWKLRYDFQAAVYMEGIKHHPDFKKFFDIGFTLEPFKFIVADTECRYAPLVFSVPEHVLEIGLKGGRTSVREYEGFEQAIERYEYAVTNNRWEHPMEYYEHGMLEIEI